MTRNRTTDATAAAITAAGVLFALYAALRPWHDETTVGGAVAAMGSTAWVVSHVLAMVGFILLPLAPLAVHAVVRDLPGAARPVRTAIAATWVGAGLTLPYYGAETFGLHALGAAGADGDAIDILGLAESVRFQPIAMTMFGLGLILVAVGAVLTAVAVWRGDGAIPRTGAVIFAVAFTLFLPQFFTPAPVRIAHGLLVAVGCAWLAMSVRRPARVIGDGVVAADRSR